MYQRMNEENKNWFRISKLLIDVGADVLHRLVVENIQTSFLNKSVLRWQRKVDKVKNKNYAKKLWKCFKNDLTEMDETCEIHLRPLHNNWRWNENPNRKFLEQVPTLQKWALDIERSLSPCFNQELNDLALSTKLLFWLEQVRDSIKNLKFLSDNLQYLNIIFLEICQQSQKNLLREIKNHYDDFLSSSIDKLLQRIGTSNEEMKDHLTILESDRKKMLESWKNVSDKHVKFLGQEIKDLLVSLERRAPHTPLLKKICSDLKTIADEIDGKELQKSCDTWHQELHLLIDNWLVTIDSVQPSSHICTNTNFVQEIKRFPSISSIQINDFFLSRETELNQLKESKELSEEQYCKICTFSNLHDPQQFGSTLLFIVSRNFLLYPPTFGWSVQPPEFDMSLSAEIVRLRSFRNTIIERSDKASIKQVEFDTLWLSVQNVLCRLAAGSGNEYERNVSENVKYLKTCPFSPERESEWNRILDWCRNDILADFKGLAEMHRCLDIVDSVQKAEVERSRRRDEDMIKQQQQEAMNKKLKEKDSQLQEKERLSQEQQDAMNRIRQENERLRQQHEAMNRQLQEKERLRQQLEAINRLLQEKERSRQQQEEAMNKLRQENEKLNYENEAMNKKLKEKDSQLQEKERLRLEQQDENRKLMHYAERLGREKNEAMNKLRQENEKLNYENEAMNKKLKEKERLIERYKELLEQQQEQERSREPQEEESEIPTSIRQGARKGWEAGNEFAGPVGGVVTAAGGVITGIFGGIGRTLFKK